VGLQDRIFRRVESLRVEERGVGGCAVIGVLLLLLLLLVESGEDVDVLVEVFVDVEEVCWREWERGVVTRMMIVFKIEAVGGSEKPAFMDIAICIKGR
jgi:hypothetical protein